MHNIPRALTIAGSDSGGGAGIQADLKTFTALRVFGMSAITALTAQNSVGVAGVHEVPPDFVAQQIDTVAQDIGVDAVKTGMLSHAGIIEAVVDSLKRNKLAHIVVDPVMVAKSGDTLLQRSACDALLQQLLPLAEIVTPNVPEAAILAEQAIETLEDLQEAARRIHAHGVRYVLMKGGHLETADAIDYLFDGDQMIELPGPRIATKNTHGTGCTYSAAIAAYLSRGLSVPEAVRQGKDYVTEAIRQSLDLGQGHGPLKHYWPVG